MTPPLVSVVIPAFNSCRTLGLTLASVFAQTHPSIEIIVVDDGSTDATADLLLSYGGRVRTIRQPNKGLAGARNTGCTSARGEFIALMDADDLCMPERLEVQLRALLLFPEAVLCSTDFSSFNEGGLVERSFGARYYSQIQQAAGGMSSFFQKRRHLEVPQSEEARPPGPTTVTAYCGTVYRQLVRGNFVHPPTVLFRRRVLEEAGPFDEDLRFTCDWEWLVRAARTGPFVYVDRPLLQYRLSETQMSSRQGNGGRGAVEIVLAASKIWRSDPVLSAADHRLMQQDLGEFCLDAAVALADWSRLEALGMLARSVWTHGTVRSETLRVILKLLLPRGLLGLARRVLAWLRGRSRT